MSKPALQSIADNFNEIGDIDKETITLARTSYENTMNAIRVKEIESEQITSRDIRTHEDTPQVTVQDIKAAMNRPMIERELAENELVNDKETHQYDEDKIVHDDPSYEEEREL